MCLPQNAKIADVQTSPYGYDVRLEDGLTGSVANDPNARYYEDVQSYLGKSAPQNQGGPSAASPNAGKLSLSTIGADHDRGGVTNIADVPEGGRYDLGTRTINQVGGMSNTIDRAPATAGNIAQAVGNAAGIATGGLGMAGTIGNMLTDQASDIGQGSIAQAVDGFLGGKPVSSTSAQSAKAKAGGFIPTGGGGRDSTRGMSRDERAATAQGRATPGRMAELNRSIGASFGGGGGQGSGSSGSRSPGGAGARGY